MAVGATRVTAQKDRSVVTRSPVAEPAPAQAPEAKLAETFGAEASNPTGDPIGGGKGYTKAVAEASARYVVSTREELLGALKHAGPGEIVFVKGNATIDLSGTSRNLLPAGVTLASDRGRNGSAGALLKRHRTPGITFSQTPCFLITGNNVRVTGLRFDGGETVRDQLTDQLVPPLMPLAAIMAEGVQGLEIDNNEMYGFSYACIALHNVDDAGVASPNANAWVHHNSLHHCQARGYGYGVVLAAGRVLCEANVFDYTRHAIAAEGQPGERYEYRYNHHLGHGYPIGASVCDVHAYPPGDHEDEHSRAGEEYKIHHNTFERPERPDRSDNYAIGIRARPATGVYVDHNVFKYNRASGEPVFYRACQHEGRVHMSSNLIGYDDQPPGLVAGEAIMYTYPPGCPGAAAK